MNLSTFTLKSIFFHSRCDESLPIPAFVTSCIGHLESIGSLSYIGLSNICTVCYEIFLKNRVCYSTADLIRNIFVSGSCQVDASFPNVRFSLWKLKRHHWRQVVVHCFPWSDRLTLFIFEKTSAESSSLNNQHLSVSSLAYKWHFMNTEANSACNPNSHTRAFPLIPVTLHRAVVILSECFPFPLPND